MKKHLSIRGRIMLLFSGTMIVSMILMFFLVRIVTNAVMEKVLSDYLISAVDANTDKLAYLPDTEISPEAIDQNDLYLDYRDGQLQIDDDFLYILNDVQSGLYLSDGSLIYGDNPLTKKMDGESFTKSRLYHKTIDNKEYIVYDRPIIKSGLEVLWIRGLVPLEQQRTQLNKITQIVLVFIPLLLVLVFFASRMAAWTILKPIQKMEKTATEIISADDLGRRIELGDNRDELYSLAESYNRMFDRLESSFAREKQFSSDVSHELRNPIAVIQAQCDFALSKEREPGEYIETISVIAKQNHRMYRLVENMLKLARIGRNTDDYPMKELDLSRLTASVCEDMSRISCNNITLTTQIEDDITVYGNSDLLEQMLVNLIDNTFKYGRENGHTEITLRRQDSDVRLDIVDDGVGIQAETKEKIFDRFFREDNSRGEVKGYGLGLSLVKAIVSLHGGSIDVDSEPGNGSRFTVVLTMAS